MHTHRITEIEARRQALQQARDGLRAPPVRNGLGQFATPAPLAAEIMQCARAWLGHAPVRFLDPAIGTGAFYSALLRAWPIGDIAAAQGYEIDRHYGEPCRALWRETPLRLRLEDFTAAAPPTTESRRFNLVICNPPYVRHHHLSRATKRRLRAGTERAAGLRLDGRAGLHAHFLALAHPWMQRGAIAGWLLPGELMDVNYGDELKRYLLESVTLLRLHRFDPADLQFGDAMVSSVILWFRNEPPSQRTSVELTYGGSLLRPQRQRVVSRLQLQRSMKWSQTRSARAPRRAAAVASLSDYFRVVRGIATGANAFFIMTPAQAAARQIPAQFLRPILPGPRLLESDEIQADASGQPLLSRPLCLLDCDVAENEIRDRYPQLWRELERARVALSQRYLCSRRSPWYSQERREPTFFLCTYMGRERADGRAQRFVFNRSRAIAANTYLLLYPREQLAHFIGADVERARRVWLELCRVRPQLLAASGRIYGGGMHKIEPRELAALPAPGISRLLRE